MLLNPIGRPLGGHYQTFALGGMKENYLNLFLVYETDGYNVYGIGGRYIKKPYFEDGIVEVKQVVKTIKVIDWEEVK